MLQIIKDTIPEIDKLITKTDNSDKNVQRFIEYYNSIKTYYKSPKNETACYSDCYGILDIKSKLTRIIEGKSAIEVGFEENLITPFKREKGTLKATL